MIEDEFVLTEKACAAFMRQIVEAVAYIHRQHIIHLDLKVWNGKAYFNKLKQLFEYQHLLLLRDQDSCFPVLVSPTP